MDLNSLTFIQLSQTFLSVTRKVPSAGGSIWENNAVTDFLERLAWSEFAHWFGLQVPFSVHVYLVYVWRTSPKDVESKEPLVNLPKCSIRNQSVKFLFVFLSFLLSVLNQFVLLVNFSQRKPVPFLFVQNINQIHSIRCTIFAPYFVFFYFYSTLTVEFSKCICSNCWILAQLFVQTGKFVVVMERPKAKFCKTQMTNYLLASRGTLLMELGLLRDFFGNFISIWGEKYYFHVEGSMRGAYKVRCCSRVMVHVGAHEVGIPTMTVATWGEKWPQKVKISMWGENGRVRWKMPCKVKMPMSGENGLLGEKWPYEPPSEILHSLIFLSCCQTVISNHFIGC